MKSIEIESSNIKSLFYDEIKNELLVFFKSKPSLYIYKNVDKYIYNKIKNMNKQDIGKYLKNNLFDTYNYKKIY